MNWTEEDIDQLFKDSANQLNVPFQESYWTEMEAMLPPTDNKKGFGWIFGGTIACLVLISTFFFPESTGKSLNDSKVIAQIEGKQHEVLRTSSSKLKTKSNIAAIPSTTKILNKLLVQKHTSIHNLFTKSESATVRFDVTSPNENLAINSQSIDLENQSIQTVQEYISIQKLPLLSIAPRENFLATSTFKNIRLSGKSNYLFVQVGAGLAESFMQTIGENWMPNLNIGAGYQNSPVGFGFSAGLNLNMAFANNLEINRKSKIYNFGSTNYEQNFKYKQIYTLDLPMSVDFRKNRQTFSLGLAPTFIASSLMRFSQLEDGKLSQDEFFIGQKVGLNHFGLKPSVAYQLELAKGWKLGVQLSTQLVQQLDGSQFIGEVRNNPLNGQITIRKTIIKL